MHMTLARCLYIDSISKWLLNQKPDLFRRTTAPAVLVYVEYAKEDKLKWCRFGTFEGNEYYSDCLLTCKLLKQLYKVAATTEAEEEVASSDDTGAGSAADQRYL